MNSGYDLHFSKGVCTITDVNTGILFTSVRMMTKRLFYLSMTDVGSAHAALNTDEESKLCHLKYGHLNMRSIQQMKTNYLVEGLPNITSTGPCEGCSLGKQTKYVFPTGTARHTTTPLELIHANLMGPMQTVSLSRNRFVFLLTNDHTRYIWVCFLPSKVDALESFKSFQRLVEKQLGYILKLLQTDREGEFVSKDFDSHCDLHGIQRQLTAPYSPQQNDVAEWHNRTVMEMTRSIPKERNVRHFLWVDVVSTTVYIRNHSSCSTIGVITAYEALFGQKPRVGQLHVFGCVVHALVDS